MLVLSLGLFSSCRDQEVNSEEELENAPSTSPPSNPGADTTTTGDDATAEVNPEHGQPGHRCDIPVGAPLNQESSQEASQTSGSNQMTDSPVRLRNSQPEKNPPHGEPGHDCSVPVGADLGE